VRLAAVFALALTARLLFVFAADEPLLYSHQYTYFTNALRIAEHPHPVQYVLYSDEWRTWDQNWTIAPLYHLFAAGIFRLFGRAPAGAPAAPMRHRLRGSRWAVAVLGRAAAGTARELGGRRLRALLAGHRDAELDHDRERAHLPADRGGRGPGRGAV
jgi:hypothetical protein